MYQMYSNTLYWLGSMGRQAFTFRGDSLDPW